MHGSQYKQELNEVDKARWQRLYPAVMSILIMATTAGATKEKLAEQAEYILCMFREREAKH